MFIPYSRPPLGQRGSGGAAIPSFLDGTTAENIDWETVASFGHEWERFHAFDPDEIDRLAATYFDIVDPAILSGDARVLEIGCGTGRWMCHLAPQVATVDGIEPSSAVDVARRAVLPHGNARVAHADLSSVPFPEASFDLVLALGVLHHMPDTARAMADAVRHVRPGGHFLVYLYYALDNRGPGYRALFRGAHLLRLGVSRMPPRVKALLCDAMAVLFYLPFVGLGRLVEAVAGARAADRLPLASYRRTSFYIMRNDARDRFGTPLEQRFSKAEIRAMMESAGLEDIRFSDAAP